MNVLRNVFSGLLLVQLKCHFLSANFPHLQLLSLPTYHHNYSVYLKPFRNIRFNL